MPQTLAHRVPDFSSRRSFLKKHTKDDAEGHSSRNRSIRTRGRTYMEGQRYSARRKRIAAREHLKRKLHPDRRFLHGSLEMHILEARNLPNLDSVGLSDPYVTVDVYRNGRSMCRIAKTRIIDDNLNPQWEEVFRLPICYRVDELRFKVKDKDVMSAEYIGFMSISGKVLATGDNIEGWFDLKASRKAMFKTLDFSKIFPSRKFQASLRLKVVYIPVDSAPLSITVPGAVFPPRNGCHVRLYQDAHTPAVPPITDVQDINGNPYNPHSLWMDIADAIDRAEKLIYIIGWSVKHDLRLRRDGSSDELLGDVLKRKASSGVRVLIMLWKEATSTDLYPPGLMGTHDIATKNFFKGSGVFVLPAPRHKNKSKHKFDSLYTTTAYTHHQKCVILDAAVDNVDGRSDGRKLVGFVGGIDLTDGRWDTPSHELFRTLPNEHRDDFYNGICPASVTTGPREPWHDVHMFVDGPVVMDLLTNFEQRWKQQGGALQLEDKLLAFLEEDFVLHSPEAKDERSWNVQLFRSIGSDSAKFDPSTFDSLLSSKGRKYENSIQRAYIHQIRRAKQFIYIENQYFLGSSHGWVKKETLKCPHLIPLELTYRIIRAIENNEEFRVYIVIPLHPEGSPTGSTVQEILRWQYRTIQMMYRRIGKAIEKEDVDAVPQDYLRFFCLGKREGPIDVPTSLEKPPRKSISHSVRESLRFMIYVHSKFAIFDDEYVIVGSANINERSMAGMRDTEMALGGHQPAFTADGSENGTEGDIRTFRLALWAEHCGVHMDEHLTPSSATCMHAMGRVGDENLANFLSDHPPERTDSHLMAYPLVVTRHGRVFRRMDRFGTFPDTGGSVKGRNSLMLPNSLTT